MSNVNGFDYVAGKKVTLTRAQARALVATGRRRVHDGETFRHDPKSGLITHEFYTILPEGAPKRGVK